MKSSPRYLVDEHTHTHTQLLIGSEALSTGLKIAFKPH
jgi:hypothetical protein